MVETPSLDFAVFRPFNWFWLKPLSVNFPMSLTSAAVNDPFCAAGAFALPNAVAVTTTAASATTHASIIPRENFTYPPLLV